MEDELVEMINFQNKEIRNRMIEYLKCFDVTDMEQHAEKIKKMKKENYLRAESQLHGMLMSVISIKTILKKLESNSQSQPT